MNKLITTLAVIGVAIGVAVAVDHIQIRDTGAGYQIGTTVNQAVGFFGAAPVSRQAVGNAATTTGSAAATVTPTSVAGATQAALTLEGATITYAGVDGSTNTQYVVTNVTINAVYGFASSQATITTGVSVGGGCYGFTTAAQANAIRALANSNRTALVNLGLASSDGL